MSDETNADDVAADTNILRRTLEACIFAPVGVAMNIAEDLPGLIGKGRDRVEQEISNARVAGEYVVGRFQRRMYSRLDSLLHSGDGATPGAPQEPESTTPHTVTPPTRPAPDAADAATLGAALADYDTLSASQVVRRLEGLGPEELRAVQRYESATRHRRTILNRAGQLLEEGPATASSG
ncbi:MAG TPA: hypothetical protein VMP41_08635 [Acidimicrobiales bacterium]|nr:hypothetical protein [Acidimicrobiales bacterium]